MVKNSGVFRDAPIYKSLFVPNLSIHGHPVFSHHTMNLC